MEAVATTFVMTLLLMGTVSMMKAAICACDSDMTQVTTDMNAVTAMNYIVNEVREATYFEIPNSSHLTITLPIENNGQYDRTQPDTANPINYYLSDETGDIDATGTYLWRSRGDTLFCIRKDVDQLVFLEDEFNEESGKKVSIWITIRTKDQMFKGTRQTDLTQRVVYLRNY